MLKSEARDNMIRRDDIKLLNVDYEDIQALNNLNLNNAMPCGRLIKNCVHYRMCLNYLTGGHNAKINF